MSSKKQYWSQQGTQSAHSMMVRESMSSNYKVKQRVLINKGYSKQEAHKIIMGKVK